MSSILDQCRVSAKAVSCDSHVLAMFGVDIHRFQYFIAFNVARKHLHKLDCGFAMMSYSTVVLLLAGCYSSAFAILLQFIKCVRSSFNRVNIFK